MYFSFQLLNAVIIIYSVHIITCTVLLFFSFYVQTYVHEGFDYLTWQIIESFMYVGLRTNV